VIVTDSEENLDENSYSSDGYNTPQASNITTKEGSKWSVTGDKPSKFNFTGSPGIKPAII
jgi:hypothetical protein